MRTVAALLLLSLPAAAQEWVATDARSRALGNAGLSMAEGPEAMYWNPAFLARGAEKPFDFSTGSGFSLYGFGESGIEGDILGDLDHAVDLYSEFDFEAMQQRMNTGTHTPQDVQNALEIVDAILALDAPGKGALSHAGGGFELKVGPIGIFARGLGAAAIDPFYDFGGPGAALTSDSLAAFFGQLPDAAVALSPAGSALSAQLVACGLTGNSDGAGVPDADELAFQAQLALGDAGISNPAFQQALCDIVKATLNNTGGSSTNTLYFTGSGVEVRSILKREVGLAFGLPVFPTVLNVGIALKEILFDTFYRRITFEELDQDDDLADKVRDDYKENRKRSREFNVDFGATVLPLPWVSLSLAARDLLPMEVDINGPAGHINLDPMWRAGLQLKPLSWIKMGVDIDLTEDDSELLQGFKSRYFGAGLELDIPVFKIRAGYFENLSSDFSTGVWTGGFGIDFYLFRLDIGAQLAMSEVRIEQQDSQDEEVEVPERLGVGVMLRVDLPF